MQWSKAKTQLKALICPELRDRVNFHVTRFRAAHDQKGRGWVTIDGEEILDCSFYKWHMAVQVEMQKSLKKLPARPGSKEYLLRHQTAWETVHANHVLDDRFFKESLMAYVDLPIKDAFNSANPLIKAFSFIDRRIGKRTFEGICLTENEHPLVQTFYELRSGVFGIETVLHK